MRCCPQPAGIAPAPWDTTGHTLVGWLLLWRVRPQSVMLLRLRLLLLLSLLTHWGHPQGVVLIIIVICKDALCPFQQQAPQQAG